MRRYLALLVVAASAVTFMGAGDAAAQAVTFAKDAPLRSEPRFDAAPAAQIKQGTTGDASGKQGPWLNIKTPQATGWALTTDVIFGTGGSAGIKGFNVARAPGGTSTLGVRGFDKETIGTALGDGGAVSDAQLALLDGYAVTKDEGQSFASGKGLTASSVSY